MRRRTRDTLTIVAACLAAGEAVAFGGSLLNGYLVVHPNVAPVTGVVGAVVGAAAAAFMIQSRARREEAYRAIRTASPEALEELLTRRRTSRSTLGANDELGLTALLVATGDHDDARARLLRLPRRLTTSHKDVLHLLRLQLDLAAGDPPTRQEAFERLAELPRHKHDYVEAFKAFLVAREHVRSGRPLPPGTLARWMRDPDDDVRAYAQWARCVAELATDEGDAFADASLGAALARAARMTELADKLEARAVQIAARSNRSAPYRA